MCFVSSCVDVCLACLCFTIMDYSDDISLLTQEPSQEHSLVDYGVVYEQCMYVCCG